MTLDRFELYDIILPGEGRHHPGGGFDCSDDSSNDGSSYSEYGGYNGYDDNTIDSAFEGMPEATWNID